VDGNGQTQLVCAIMGDLTVSGGDIMINGESTTGKDTKGIRKLGVAYIPEDRMSQGVAGEASIGDNLIANRYTGQEVGNGWMFSGAKIAAFAKKLIQEFYILCAGEKQKVSMLSGGNMQKVVVARECSAEPKLLIAEQPTRGVDVGSAQFIHQNILRLREQNTAVLLVSADLNEVMELSDRLIVMFEGKIVAYFEHPSQVSEEELGLAMLGLQKQPSEEIRRAFYDQPA
jgi:simple sugar transport system ATP-binding protein